MQISHFEICFLFVRIIGQPLPFSYNKTYVNHLQLHLHFEIVTSISYLFLVAKQTRCAGNK